MAQPTAIDQMCTVFAVVHDPRRQPPPTRHPLEAIRTITILATLGGAQKWVESAPWGQATQAWLAEVLDLTQGLPSHDTCGRVFAGLDPERLQQACVRWMQALADRSQDLVAREGKTIRRGLDRADGNGPLPVVKAWASAQARVLAPFKVDAKPTELTALPAWLRRLKLAGAVVTIAALGCQVERARQIQAPGADDVRSFTEKQPGVYQAGADLCAWLRGSPPLEPSVACGRAEQVDGGHGRSETRRRWRPAALAGLSSGERWPGLTRLVRVESRRPLGEEDSVERRDDLRARPGATDDDAPRLHRVMRTHWEIATRVHWVLEGAMGEDINRARQGESAQPLALIRQLALNF